MNLDLTQIALFVLSAGMTIIGWFCRQIWAAIDDLRKDAAKLREELPKEYVPLARMDAMFDKLDAKLDRLFDRIDQKADKP